MCDYQSKLTGKFYSEYWPKKSEFLRLRGAIKMITIQIRQIPSKSISWN